MLGMDLMLEGVLQKFGVKPEEIKAQVMGFVEHVKGWMQRDEQRMIAIEKSLLSLHAKLDGAVIEEVTEAKGFLEHGNPNRSDTGSSN